jgi:hypothetical protein
MRTTSREPGRPVSAFHLVRDQEIRFCGRQPKEVEALCPVAMVDHSGPRRTGSLPSGFPLQALVDKHF